MTAERMFTPRPGTIIRGEFTVTPQVKAMINQLQRTPSELHFYTTAQQAMFADEYHNTSVEAERFRANRIVMEMGKRSLNLMRIVDIYEDYRVLMQVMPGADQARLDAISAHVVGESPRPDFPHHLLYTDLARGSLIEDAKQIEDIKEQMEARARHPSQAMRTLGARIVAQDFPRYLYKA